MMRLYSKYLKKGHLRATTSGYDYQSQLLHICTHTGLLNNAKPIPKNSSLKRVYILHLLPLEYYPPITNLLNILSKDKLVKTVVYSQKTIRIDRVFKLKTFKYLGLIIQGIKKTIILKFWSFFTYVFLPLWQLIDI